jgi:uncharacterized damage-inducible protein DinB
MKPDNKVLEETIGGALSGKDAHVGPGKVFEGLDWKVAGACPSGSPHSIFQILNHLTFWQDWVIKWLDGGKPTVPKHASGGWPGKPEPSSAKEWEAAVRGFEKGLGDMNRRIRAVDLLSKRGKKTRLEMLRAIASHNSYHLGQAVLLRQMLGAWPPPSGGLTW